MREVEHIVQHAHLRENSLHEGIEIKTGRDALQTKGMLYKFGQDHWAQIATAIGWQRLLTTRIGSFQRFAIPQVVVAVDVV